MWIIQLAWKNSWRNKGRTIITISAVAFATLISMITASLKEGVFDNLIKNIVSSYTGHIQIHHKGYQDEQILENGFFPNDSLLEKIKMRSGIESITPRIESFALLSAGESTRGCLIMGIGPEEKKTFTAMEQKLIEGHYTDPDANALLLSEGLAHSLKMTVNDTVVIIGQGYHGVSAAGKYPVSGIIRLASPKLNERLVVMPIALAQRLFGADSIATSWCVLLKENTNVDLVANDLKGTIDDDFEVLTWAEIMPDIKQHIDTDSNNMQIVRYILYLLVSFGIFSTLLIMMSERKIEHGMLLALGMSKKRLELLLMVESLMTLMVGSLLGLLISLPLVIYLKKYPIHISGNAAEAYKRFGFEPIFPAALDPVIFLQQGLTVFTIGIILSLYPIWVIRRMNALNAMKK